MLVKLEVRVVARFCFSMSSFLLQFVSFSYSLSVIIEHYMPDVYDLVQKLSKNHIG